MNQKEWMEMSFEEKAQFLKFSINDLEEDSRERLYELFSVIGRKNVMDLLELSKSAYYRLRSGTIRGEGSSLTARQLAALCFYAGYSATWVITGTGSKYLFELPLQKTTARLARDADQALLMSEQILQNLRDIQANSATVAGTPISTRTMDDLSDS